MSREEILEKLNIDEHYYGEFGQQFLSNSNVSQLNGNIADFNKPSEPSVPLLVGGAFHTMMLEPHKMDNYPIVDCSTRNTKIYKKASEEAGKMLLIKKDHELLKSLRSTLENHTFTFGANGKTLLDLVQDGEVETPGYGKLFGQWFKGKADVINHDAKLIIDLKTTSNIDGFENSANKFGYDSQAFIYRELFGYDMVFLTFCKKTMRVGFFDCSPEFYERGREKVVDAVYSYKHNYKKEKEEDFNYNNYLIVKTL